MDFVEALFAKGCVAPHMAPMSGEWSEADEARAVRLGCRLFARPFPLTEIDAWLTKVETLVPPDRGAFAVECARVVGPTDSRRKATLTDCFDSPRTDGIHETRASSVFPAPS